MFRIEKDGQVVTGDGSVIQIKNGGQVVASGTDLSVVTNYAKAHRALVARDVQCLHVSFDDGATCCVEFSDGYAIAKSLDQMRNLDLWIKRQVDAKDSPMAEADGTAHFKLVVAESSASYSPMQVYRSGGKIYSAYLYNSHAEINRAGEPPSFHLHHVYDMPAVAQDDDIEEELFRLASTKQDAYLQASDVANLPVVMDFGVMLIQDVEFGVPGRIGQPLWEIREDCMVDAQAARGGLTVPHEEAPAPMAG